MTCELEAGTTMPVNDRPLEFSPLSGRVTRDGFTVEVKIYRFRGDAADWALEVIDHEGGSTVWNELFASDDAAYEAFRLAVNEDGIGSFAGPGETLH